MKNSYVSMLLLTLLGLITSPAFAAGGTVTSPTGIAPDRYVYYPGTEELAKDEIRVIACGTGLPAARTEPGGHLLFDRSRQRRRNSCLISAPARWQILRP